MQSDTLFKRIFSNPWIGFLGSLASLIGLGLAVFFYFLSIRAPELTYFVSPIRTSIVKQTNTSGLSVLYNNVPLDSDVSSLQIALWNAGKQPIERDDILSPVRIFLGSNIKILEATVVRTSRDAAAFSIKSDPKTLGAIDIDWRILENGDGGVIQIIYAGESSIDPKVSGAITGQNSMKKISYSGSISTPEEQLRSSNTVYLITGIAAIFTSALSLISSYIFRTRSSATSPSKLRKKKRIFQVFKVLFPIAYTIFGIYLIARAFTRPTPFDM